MVKAKKIELYVTQVEYEAYDLVGQLCLPPNQVRCHVEHRKTKRDNPFYVVVIESADTLDRARAVRDRMFK